MKKLVLNLLLMSRIVLATAIDPSLGAEGGGRTYTVDYELLSGRYLWYLPHLYTMY